MTLLFSRNGWLSRVASVHLLELAWPPDLVERRHQFTRLIAGGFHRPSATCGFGA